MERTKRRQAQKAKTKTKKHQSGRDSYQGTTDAQTLQISLLQEGFDGEEAKVQPHSESYRATMQCPYGVQNPGVLTAKAMEAGKTNPP